MLPFGEVKKERFSCRQTTLFIKNTEHSPTLKRLLFNTKSILPLLLHLPLVQHQKQADQLIQCC